MYGCKQLQTWNYLFFDCTVKYYINTTFDFLIVSVIGDSCSWYQFIWIKDKHVFLQFFQLVDQNTKKNFDYRTSFSIVLQSYIVDRHLVDKHLLQVSSYS